MQGMVPPSAQEPIRNSSGAVSYVIHDSVLIAYAESVSQTTTTLDKTIGDLMSVPSFKNLSRRSALFPRRQPLPMRPN